MTGWTENETGMAGRLIKRRKEERFLHDCGQDPAVFLNSEKRGDVYGQYKNSRSPDGRTGREKIKEGRIPAPCTYRIREKHGDPAEKGREPPSAGAKQLSGEMGQLQTQMHQDKRDYGTHPDAFFESLHNSSGIT